MTITSDFLHRITPLLEEVGRTNKEREKGIRSAVDGVRSAQSCGNAEAVIAALEGVKRSFSPQFRSSQPRVVSDLTRIIDDEIARIRGVDKKRTLEEEGTGESIAKAPCTVERMEIEEPPISPMAIIHSYVLRMITAHISDADRHNLVLALSQHPQTEAVRRDALMVDFDYCRLLVSNPELQKLFQKTFGPSERLPAVAARENLQAMQNKELAVLFKPFKDFVTRLQSEWERLPGQIQQKFFVDTPLQFQTLLENPEPCKEILRAIRSYNLVSLVLKANVFFEHDPGHPQKMRNFVFGAESGGDCFRYTRDELISRAEKVAQYLQSDTKVTGIYISDDSNRPDAMTLIPFEVIERSALTNVALRHQRLTSIPAQIVMLSELAFLDLTGNEPISLPNTMGELQRLNFLQVDSPACIPASLWERVRSGKLRIYDNSSRGYLLSPSSSSQTAPANDLLSRTPRLEQRRLETQQRADPLFERSALETEQHLRRLIDERVWQILRDREDTH